jgi:tetratricopeptide (TPR) repeat protein
MPRQRSRNRALAVILALFLPAIGLAPVVASGEPKKPTTKAADDKGEKGEKYDPENTTAISRYMETIAKGDERFEAKDYTAAIDAYRKAVQLSPRQTLAHCLLAEAYIVNNNLGEAEAAIAAALETNDPKTPHHRARALFLAAALNERQKKWEQAKVAWQAYADFLGKTADAGGYPQTAADRIKVIQKVQDLDKAMVAVRERIAAEKADAGKAPAKP